MGFCDKLAKLVLVVFNLLFFLLGALMLGFGITAKASPKSIEDVFSHIIPADEQGHLKEVGVDISQIVVSNAIFMIILGVVALLVAGFGLIGACCLVKWMLIVYVIVMILVILAEIGLIIFAAVYNNKFSDTMKDAMYKSLEKEFKNGLKVNGTDQVIFPTGGVELAWVGLQLQGECCGARSYSDYFNISWSRQVFVPSNSTTHSAKVPLSCCKLNEVTKKPTKDDFENILGCLDGDKRYINEKNCFDAYKEKVDELIEKNKGIAIGIAAGIVALEIILIIFALILYRRASKDDKFV